MIGDLVRTSCRRVVDAAQLVIVDTDRLAVVASTLGAIGFEATGFEMADGPGDVEAEVGRIVSLNAVNFGSGYHDHVDKEPGLSGARTMAARWGRYWAADRPSPGDLTRLSAEDCAAIFGQRLDDPVQRELIERFATALNSLGSFLADGYGGSFAALVEAAEGSAQRLAESLLAMPFYRDRVRLDGKDVHFYKRAQITAADLARDVGWWPPCRFDDLDRLTAFADNLVPHVLRVDGALRYDPELAARIDGGQPLPAGERAEVEIRAAGVVAVEALAALVPDYAGPMDVDLALWRRGQDPHYKAIPRHRTRSIFY